MTGRLLTTRAMRATFACIAIGISAGASLGVPRGWLVVQAALVALQWLMMSPKLSPLAGGCRLAVFSIGLLGAAYLGFAIAVPEGTHLLAAIPLALLIVANAACACCIGASVVFATSRPLVRGCLMLPAFWMFQEWLFSLGKLAFPWARLGYAQAPDGPLAGMLPWGGSLLASGATLMLAALIVHALQYRLARGRCVMTAAALLLFARAGIGIDWTQPTSTLRVDLVQSGITTTEKLRPGTSIELLKLYRDVVLASDAPLIVSSQTAIPKLPAALPPGYLQELASSLEGRHADAMLGMYFEQQGRVEFFNGVLALGASGPQHYLKYQLFPFGEFIPLRGWLLDWVLRSLPTPMRDTAAAPEPEGPLWAEGHRIALALCYEAAFAQTLRRQAATADILINIASDSAVPSDQLARQFRQIDQARALELQKPLLRTSDVQGTFALDAWGHVSTELSAGGFGVLSATVAGRSGLTPYARFGDGLALGISAVLVLLATLQRWERPRPAGCPIVRADRPSTAWTRSYRQAGQVLPMSIGLLLVAAGFFYLMVNAGQSVTEKIRLTNAADAAAYSAGVVEARVLNYDAYLNRAMVANEIAIAQAVSYGSWLEYVATAADNYHDAADLINFFIQPNPDVNTLNAVFGGSEALSHYYGTTVQEYVDYFVDGLGVVITAYDLAVRELATAQFAVHANMSELSDVVLPDIAPQTQIIKTVVQAMDPSMDAMVVPTSHTFGAFTKRYVKDNDGVDERGRLADVTVRSRDPFTRERNWTMDSFDIPLVRQGGELKKRAGTELIGYDEWRGVDTLELHGSLWGCGRLLPTWCDDVAKPVGWGALEIDTGGGDAGRGYHGNAYGDNPEAGDQADDNMQAPPYYSFSGIAENREISDLDPANPQTTGVTVLVTKAQGATLTSGNAATAAPSGRLSMFSDHPAGGKLIALSRATVYFDRIAKRADGKEEIGSLYNPYWRVHLTAPTAGDKAFAAIKQDGLALPP